MHWNELEEQKDGSSLVPTVLVSVVKKVNAERTITAKQLVPWKHENEKTNYLWPIISSSELEKLLADKLNDNHLDPPSPVIPSNSVTV
ncbi:unnamed protein product [Allacma fusca]|uniref:Uncharacterized protein n=1 Tax=Allacma fusca TaxID=39272 RepID=A0A8J2KJA7_9HEXA|nr:unnamed protein product [Allacma fusca]